MHIYICCCVILSSYYIRIILHHVALHFIEFSVLCYLKLRFLILLPHIFYCALWVRTMHFTLHTVCIYLSCVILWHARSYVLSVLQDDIVHIYIYICTYVLNRYVYIYICI